MGRGYQVLKFAMVDFDTLWRREVRPDAVIEYVRVRSATEPKLGSKLKVYCEEQTGPVTYSYDIRDAIASVLISDRVIHIPDRCVSKEKGNTITCG